jgi:hypothetical protein
MGNINSINSIKKYNFEDMRSAILIKDNLIINTLAEDNQECLIQGTIDIKRETSILNDSLSKTKGKLIVIYGMNNNDEKIFIQYKKLTDLGFTNVYVYIGGLFEWLLLQEIYGQEHFPTTTHELDHLKYK